jgi:hypothetical protein
MTRYSLERLSHLHILISRIALEKASESIERYVVIGSSDCRAESLLKKIGDGDPKDEHVAAKARIERLKEERIADGVEEAAD